MATAKSDKGKAKDAVGGLDAEIDSLFQLPATEFTAARNALITRLKKAGRGEDAERVKSLGRPPMTAWTVNQLYWKHRDDFDRLIATGERFRIAQASQLAGKSADVRGPLEARRSALADMARLAASVLRQGGGSATPDNMRRITTTLEALSTYGSLPDAPPAGRLTDDVQAPGFETLAALVPRVGDASRGAGPTRVIQFQHKTPPAKAKGKHTPEEDAKRAADERKARLAAARAVVRDAERALRESRKEAQQAEERLKKAAAQAKDAEQDKAAAEQRLEQATAAADAARQQARRVAAEAEEAAGVLEDAERALEKATRELTALESAE
jgi:hypothetical protein